ncbi:ribosome biogenesis protein Nop16 [Butyriboletus roseoflavus]|nr:ribosome biogenesis protein Nop16 [Butyriboletus roseoflavus]
MANPRQRRKAKSSTHTAISHSRRAKRLQKKMPAIRGPKALQDAWDPSKTLRQNYLALGLEHDLNPISSGGSEVNLSRITDQNNTSRPQPAASPCTIGDAALPKGFGRIIRDSSGDIVRVELPSDEEALLVTEAPVATTESELRIWAHCREVWREVELGGMGNAIVQDLENLAASATVRERHASFGERLSLERLVSKYGDDLHRMARDRRLNPEQRTANELKRAIAKAGGFEVLCKGTDVEVAE